MVLILLSIYNSFWFVEGPSTVSIGVPFPIFFHIIEHFLSFSTYLILSLQVLAEEAEIIETLFLSCRRLKAQTNYRIPAVTDLNMETAYETVVPLLSKTVILFPQR
jgi:hypothetical protein